MVTTSFGNLVENYTKGRKSYPEKVYVIAQKYAKRESKVLDLGCGTGISTRPLFEKFDDVRGCDIDEVMLQTAKVNHEDRYDQGSVYELPYQDQQFDLVTMFATFHWYCNDKATQEIKRVLKNQGYVFIFTKIPNSTRQWDYFDLEILRELTGEFVISSPQENFEPIEVLTQNGFMIVEDTLLSTKEDYSLEEALAFFQSRSQWNYCLKSGYADEVLAVLKTKLESLIDSKGKIYLNRASRVIVAKRN